MGIIIKEGKYIINFNESNNFTNSIKCIFNGESLIVNDLNEIGRKA